MKDPIRQFILLPLTAIGVVVVAVGCASTRENGQKEVQVNITELSGPARATIERETAGGKIEDIVREVEHNRVVYDVESNVGGKHLEWLVADADGAILGTETQIELSEAPAPVREAAEKYFNTSSGLLVMKGVEYGETHYEVEGPKNGKRVEVTFDLTGKRTE